MPAPETCLTVVRRQVLRPAIAWTLAAGAIALAASTHLEAQRPGRPATEAGTLWISESPLDDGRRMLTVVDGASRHVAVYHVDAASGSLVLRSTRDISWDLLVDDFNAQEPRPAALRRMLQAGPAATPEQPIAPR